MTTPAFFALVLLVDLLAVVLQPYCPPMERYAGAVVLMFPVVLAYGALALPFAGALALAFCNGLLWDALTVQIINPDMYLRGAAVEELPMGWSIVLFGVLAALVHGLRPLFLRGRWDLHCVASGFCTVVILVMQYGLITFKRGWVTPPHDLWVRLLLPGFFAMLLSPVVCFAFYFAAGLLNYPVRIYEDEQQRQRRARARAAGL